MGDIVNSVADVFGFGPASKQAEAVQGAAKTGADVSRYSADLQKQMFEKQLELQEPWRQAGISALSKMQQQAGGMPSPVGGFQNAMPAAFSGQVNLNQDPGYAFRMSEGMKELERSAAKRGGLLSGATLKGIQRFGQNLASQEYQNAYNRALTQYNAQTQRESTSYQRALDAYNSEVARESTGYNRLAALSGIGQTATQQLQSAAGAYGSNAGNIMMAGGANAANAALQMGNIRASQYGGIGRALGDIYGSAPVQNYLGRTFGSPAQQQAYDFEAGYTPENYG